MHAFIHTHKRLCKNLKCPIFQYKFCYRYLLYEFCFIEYRNIIDFQSLLFQKVFVVNNVCMSVKNGMLHNRPLFRQKHN